MITRIREIRKGKGLTLADVAERCEPPTTPQTIGRLETGTRTVSVDWLNRIAAALDVLPGDLVQLEDRTELDVAARLTAAGAEPLAKPRTFAAPHPHGTMMGLLVDYPHGEYRPRDELWLERLPPEKFMSAANRDILAPRPAGRFAFGRLVDMFGQRLSILPPQHGARQVVLTDVPWIAVVRTLIRAL
ncbi:transcriptional regulator [Pacificimonas flava]|uniref:Transcriptional regulator n=2 Tax=Pacificimonas TaxID=1960290 RepID=A0A219B4Z8_9SPHN|nr:MULTISPECIES: helix-turn-helix transcriptional regulator [Pacificimonas]MBZ6377025.1 helix-turn-helix transcriptional regulator [Pacificimonas aurantium]OWV33233.1 transcriptional regulator [Pacificimonas flava]